MINRERAKDYLNTRERLYVSTATRVGTRSGN